MQLAPAPRPISWPIRLQVLLGGFGAQFGLFFVCFGLLFFWIFAADTLFDMVRFRGQFKTVAGQVESANQTNMRINRVRVIAHQVDYQVAGQTYGLTAYTSGKSVAPGTAVTVLYRVDKPAIAKVEGMRTDAFGGGPVLLVLILPLIGLGMALAYFLRGLRSLRLLRTGQLAKARLTERHATNTRINNQRVWKLIFAYSVQGRSYRHSFATHQIAGLLDEQEENLLYDPAHPEHAVLLDGLPGRVRIDGNTGQLTPQQPGTSLMMLIAPVAVALMGYFGWILKAPHSW